MKLLSQEQIRDYSDKRVMLPLSGGINSIYDIKENSGGDTRCLLGPGRCTGGFQVRCMRTTLTPECTVTSRKLASKTMKRAYTETPEELEARVGVLVAQRKLQVLRERAWDAYAGQSVEFTVTGAFNAGFEAGVLSQHVSPVCVYCRSPLTAQVGYVVTTVEGQTDGCCEPCWVRMSTPDGGDFLTQEKSSIQETPVNCSACGGYWAHITDSVGHECINDAEKAREFLRSMGWTAMIRDDVIGRMIAFLHDQKR